ncbi:Trp biosynthesis-associated membrane protein [uncultured Cellulomonas sp.]|uniref:Trp biosynthesis-associated membrane protein n=1 Tax=uncultured Cellulomonas sp. TaxID=189682 RepID=UPI00260B9984|nr:Trp biosynthesis-associated membrane protein [uncultured Cellulomonas sp.]
MSLPDAPPPPAPASTGRRCAILVVLALALASLVSGVPVWLRTAGSTALEPVVPVAVTGTQAAPGVPAAALVLLAAGIAIGLAGPVGRWVVTGVVLLAGLLQLASAVSVTADPEPIARTVVAGATGVGTLTAPVVITAWPWVAAAVGVAVMVVGLWLGATSRSWSRPSARHDAARGGRSEGTAAVPDDDQAAWDALTRGHDPT